MLCASSEQATIYERRHYAFQALEEVERLGDSEVTEENLPGLRRVLVFMSQDCQYDYWCDLHDILQPVQMKLTPGYEMAPDMFSALFTEAAKYQLRKQEDFGFAKTLALNALRVEWNLHRKRQEKGSDNRRGVYKTLLLVAEVYERVCDPGRAARIREQANEFADDKN